MLEAPQSRLEGFLKNLDFLEYPKNIDSRNCLIPAFAGIEIFGRGRAGVKVNPVRRGRAGIFQIANPGCRGRAGAKKMAGIPANRGCSRDPGRLLILIGHPIFTCVGSIDEKIEVDIF